MPAMMSIPTYKYEAVEQGTRWCVQCGVVMFLDAAKQVVG